MSHIPIRLALIGCKGNTALWRDIATRLKDACFTVAVDSDDALGKSMAEAIGASVVVDSFDTALMKHHGEFDAMVTNTSSSELTPIALIAEASQKHVILNAPGGDSLPAIELLMDGDPQTKKDNYLAIRDTLRSTPSIQVIKERLDSGKLGSPSLLRVHRWRSINHDERAPLTNTLFADVDLALWLFNAKPTEVYALARGDRSADSTPDFIQIHFGFPEGGMALLDFSAALPEGKGYDSLSLIGSTGAAYSDDHNNTHLLFNGGNPDALISGQGKRHLALEIQGFVDAIIGESPPPVGMGDCLRVHQVIEAIQRSLVAKQVLHDEGGNYV